MNRATPQARKIATLLIFHETSDDQSSETATPVAFHICEKLRPHLATLMGNGGFRSLLSRALVLAKPEVPWLRTVQVNADGSLDGPEQPPAPLDPDESIKGSVVLLAHLLGLLVAFIGENLTLGLMRDVWPKVPLNDWNFGKGVTHEKAR
jgi:hypothetical protein